MNGSLVGVTVTVAAVVVVRRLVGIRRARSATTLIAVLIAQRGGDRVLRLVFGSLREVPGRAVYAAWALVTIFLVLAVLLVEPMTRQLEFRMSLTRDLGPQTGAGTEPTRSRTVQNSAATRTKSDG